MTFVKDSKEVFNEEGAGIMWLGVGKTDEFSSGYNKEKWAITAKRGRRAGRWKITKR